MGLVMIIGLKIEKIEYLFDKEMVNLLLSMGIKHFEIQIKNSDIDSYYFSKDFVKFVSELKKNNDNISISYHGTLGLNFIEKVNRLKMTSFDILRDFLNLCDKTSAKWLTLHIGECGSGRTKMTDRIELLIEDFRKFYENNKFLTPIGIENLPYQKNGKLLLGDDFRDIKKIVDRVKDFKFLFDLGHYNVAYYNDNLNELYNYIIGVHIHDNNGDIDSHKELGTGTVNYEFIIRNILKLNSEVPFVIEYRDFDIDKIKRTIKKLKEI